VWYLGKGEKGADSLSTRREKSSKGGGFYLLGMMGGEKSLKRGEGVSKIIQIWDEGVSSFL